MDWFVEYGDSNMLGQSTESHVTSSPFSTARGSMTSVYYSLRDRLLTLTDPIYPNMAPGSQKSAWPTFAMHWMAEKRRPVGFITAAWGAAAMVYEQEPAQIPLYGGMLDNECYLEQDGNHPWLAKGGQIYCWMVKQVKEVIASGLIRDQDLKAVLVGGGVVDVLFQEDPPGCAALETALQSAYDTLADDIWADIGKPIYLAKPDDTLAWPPEYLDCRTEVRNAVAWAITNNGHIYAGADALGLEMQGDDIHIKDYATMGRLWYEAVKGDF